MRHRYVLGRVDYDSNGRGARNEVAIEWELENGRFSMSAEVWNASHTDILAGGQMVDEAAALFSHDAKAQRMVEVWKRWHLNDMQAGCEHQRAGNFLANADRVVLRYRFTLDSETLCAKTKIERASAKQLAAGETVTLAPPELALVRLPYEIVRDVYEGETTPEAPSRYKFADDSFRANPERKTLRWLSADEHPDGLLSRPCAVCGYKYGSAWLREEIPAGVVDEIESWSTAAGV